MPSATKKLRSVTDLQPDQRNANKGTERGSGMLEKSLRRFGAGRSILIDKHGRIIAGNKTAETAADIGLKDLVVVQATGRQVVAVQRTDLDLARDKKAQELAIADNRVGDVNLEWDGEVLGDLGAELDLDDFFSEKELAELAGGAEAEASDGPEAKIEEAAKLAKKWRAKPGAIWQIGDHRLLCGDSTDGDEVARLFGADRASLMATDPPYGVAYGKKSGPDSAKRFPKIGNDELDGPALQEFLERAFKAALPVLADDAAWYIWHAHLTQGFFSAAAAAASLLIHRQIVWVKSHLVLGHGDFHQKHELCFYGWRQGHRAKWYGGRDQTTVWEIAQERDYKRPTQKPVEIFARAMRLSTQRGEICYEPFSGSGSQILAAEQTGRRCYAMEIDPGWCGVALERAAESGLEPKIVD